MKTNNCTKCEKGLSGAVKSKVKADKSFYLACPGCGNVMYVTVDANGITTVNPTLAKKRQYHVLKTMLEYGYITKEQAISIK